MNRPLADRTEKPLNPAQFLGAAKDFALTLLFISLALLIQGLIANDFEILKNIPPQDVEMNQATTLTANRPLPLTE